MFAAATLVLAVASAGDDAFNRGDFAAAQSAYRAAVAADPKDAAAQAGIARTELYGNHLDAAEKAARAALAVDPANAAAKRVADVVAQRREILNQASHLQVPATGVRIPFIALDPLPLLQITVNGKPANVILDTGGPDLTLDPEFANELNLKIDAGSQAGTFAGGRQAQIQTAHTDSVVAGGLKLGGLTVNLLPSRMLDFFPGKKVDGVIGTAFLSRFLSTIDYPGKQLILRPRDSALVATSSSTVLPMWFVGDHFMLTRGTINSLQNAMILIDSGLAGGGFSPGNDIIESAHVRTFPNKASQGVGGGGAVEIVPAIADKLCLETACQTNVEGSYTPSGSPLQIFPFHVDAIVSHTFLKKYAVSFDFQRMEIVLAP